MPDIKIHSNGHATPHPLHVHNGETVNFTSDDGAWTVDFKDNRSPLPKLSYSGAKGASDGGEVKGTKGEKYSYTSGCTPDGDTKHSVDPDIIIDA
jgi:hypothetical protein